jgi:hypothetical protein
LVRTVSSVSIDYLGGESHAGERIDYRIVLTVTDPVTGVTATDAIFLIDSNWVALYGGNIAPVPRFGISGFSPIRANQPVIFNAENSTDANMDYLWYTWYFGDGAIGEGAMTTHSYPSGMFLAVSIVSLINLAGNYLVTLVVQDDFWSFVNLTRMISVQPEAAIEPFVTPDAGDRYSSFTVTLSTVTAGASILYSVDGTTPTKLYTEPITIPYEPFTTVKLQTFSRSAGILDSDTVVNVYNIMPPACGDVFIQFNCSLKCYNSETPTQPTYIATVPVNNGKHLTLQSLIITLGVNHVGTVPIDQSKVLRYVIDGLYGIYDTSKSMPDLHLFVDAGSVPGQAVQARVSYDFTNDGVWDRHETFNLFACDPLPDAYEEYTFTDPLQAFQPLGITGDYQNMVNGLVQIEIWQAIGNSTITLLTNGANALGQRTLINLPYNGTYQQTPSNCTRKFFIFDIPNNCSPL